MSDTGGSAKENKETATVVVVDEPRVWNCLKVVPATDPANRKLRFQMMMPDSSVLFQVVDVTDTCVSPDKSLICLLVRDTANTPLLKVSHRKGIPSVTICSPTGILIGESISDVRIGCCSINPTYTLLSRFGKQLLVLNGKARCCPPGLKVRVKTGGSDGRNLATMSLSTLASFSAEVKFLPEEKVSEHSRNLILGMALGIILQSQDAQYSKNP